MKILKAAHLCYVYLVLFVFFLIGIHSMQRLKDHFKALQEKEAFYRQRIPEPSCARKETVGIDILVTSRNGDRKIMQSIRIISRPPSRKRKSIELSQCWRKSSTMPRVHEKHQLMDQQSCMFDFVAYLKIPGSN